MIYIIKQSNITMKKYIKKSVILSIADKQLARLYKYSDSDSDYNSNISESQCNIYFERLIIYFKTIINLKK